MGTGNSWHLCVVWAEQMKIMPVCGASVLEVSDWMHVNIGQSNTQTLVLGLLVKQKDIQGQNPY